MYKLCLQVFIENLHSNILKNTDDYQKIHEKIGIAKLYKSLLC